MRVRIVVSGDRCRRRTRRRCPHVRRARRVKAGRGADFARRAVLLADPGIEDYEFVQVSRSRVKVRVVLRAGAGQESIIRAVEHEVRATLDGLGCAPVEVDVSCVAALVRAGSKLRRVRSEMDRGLGDGEPVVQESGAWPSSSS